MRISDWSSDVCAQDTWSGRGLQPRWLAELVKQGRKAEEFLIDKVSVGAARKPAAKTVRKAASKSKRPAARKTPRTSSRKATAKRGRKRTEKGRGGKDWGSQGRHRGWPEE